MSEGNPQYVPLDEIEGAAIYGDSPLPEEPPGFFYPVGESIAAKPNKFKFESVADILANFNPGNEEWLVKKLLPRVGVGTLFGQSMSFKSFVALDIGGHIANGWNWGDRKTRQGAVVYVAAEGAAGVRKRVVGFQQYNHERGATSLAPFHMTAVAPNLGTGQDDLKELIAAVEANCPNPAFIALDTAAQSLGGADENGQGMAQLLINAIALSNHFGCFVLMVHHVGLSDDQRMRGWSGLKCGIDVELLCEREPKTMVTTLSLKKLKDEETSLQLAVSMDRIVIGHDEDGDEVSTLAVADIKEETEKPKANKSTKAVPAGQRLLMDMVAVTLDEAGKNIRPFANGPLVRVAADGAVRERYYARIAETTKPDDTPKKLADRQRQAFCASIKRAIDAKMLVAAQHNGERVLWLP
jgi:AAA domain